MAPPFSPGWSRCVDTPRGPECYKTYSKIQCCGSMTFWRGSGSGSADPCLIRIGVLLNIQYRTIYRYLNIQKHFPSDLLPFNKRSVPVPHRLESRTEH